MQRKTAFITGASHGIGRGIAAKLASEGCALAINCARSTEELIAFSRQLEQDYHIPVLPLTGDVSDYRTVETMFQEAESFLHGIDYLVNNAGRSHIGLLSNMTPEEWHELMDTNLSSVFYCCKQVIPSMVRKKSGRILNISSVWGEVGASCEAAYSATKGGVNALTRALAKELAPSSIQVNAISCGCIDTRMNACFSAEERDAIEQDIPAGRFGKVEEVADLAWRLLDGCGYLTGQVIRLDGGWI